MAGLFFLMLLRIQGPDIRWAAAGAAYLGLIGTERPRISCWCMADTAAARYLGLSDEQFSALRGNRETTLTDAQRARLPLLSLERAIDSSLGPLERGECLCP
ncbi:MAG TPA: hypothetical protein VKB79_03530 [Bryobacteraceae bacterium]|nr:hypothetical protein [Bryobacteraceae bacterium]